MLGLLVHEVMHCVLHHMSRRGDRDPKKFNVACDYAINPIVIDSHFVLPEGGLIDDNYRNMSAEHIYSILPDPPEDFGQFGIGGVIDSGKDDKGEDIQGGISDQELEIEWDIAIAQAASLAKSMGKLPGALTEILADVLDPKVDWRTKLNQFMQVAKDDYSWMRPNRHFIARKMYLPSLWSERVGDIVVAIDSSGSVSDEELQQFLGEMTSICHDCNPTTVHLIACDTRVNYYKPYTREDLPLKKMEMSRGGTYFSPVFNYVKENNIEPEALVYLTDLGSNDYGDAPDYPVLWISSCKGDLPPFGEVTFL